MSIENKLTGKNRKFMMLWIHKIMTKADIISDLPPWSYSWLKKASKRELLTCKLKFCQIARRISWMRVFWISFPMNISSERKKYLNLVF